MSPGYRRLTTFAVMLMAGCGSGSSPAPSSPSAVPGPTAAPTAAPVATPAPNSSLPASCRNLPAATGTAAGCHQEAPDFVRQVTEAVSFAENSTATDPDSRETFPMTRDGQIQSPSAYVRLIVESLDRQGLCAAWDGEEINVRRTSGYNEHYDVLTSTGSTWIKYEATCTPALPIPALATPPARDSECRLPPSRESYCGRLGATYDGDVSTALDELIAQDRQLASPLMFNFTDRAPGTDNGWKVTNVPLYFSEMSKKLRAKGYCSVREGDDELWIKKGTNRFSEHWDLLRGEGHSLRLLASVCRDAAF